MKKFLFAIVLLCGLNHMVVGQTTYSRYDVNRDGRVSIDDATWVVHNLLGGADNQDLDPADADVNQDGRVNMDDVKWVVNRLLGRPNNMITEIKFVNSFITLYVGDSWVPRYTVTPSDADLQMLTWSSSKESVATVDSDGVITAISPGTTSIYGKTMDGSGVSRSCMVTVESRPEGNTDFAHNGYTFVDMGLSVMWASCNIGASSPEDGGDYYAWGETETSTYYWWTEYKWCKGKYTALLKYNSKESWGIVDNKTVLDLEDDAAHVNWGGKWRIPTQKEWGELANSFNCSYLYDSERKGYVVTSNKTGNSIFLPLAGYWQGNSVSSKGSVGCYWANSCRDDVPAEAFEMYLNWRDFSGYTGYRDVGQSIRPVCSY